MHSFIPHTFSNVYLEQKQNDPKQAAAFKQLRLHHICVSAVPATLLA